MQRLEVSGAVDHYSGRYASNGLYIDTNVLQARNVVNLLLLLLSFIAYPEWSTFSFPP